MPVPPARSRIGRIALGLVLAVALVGGAPLSPLTPRADAAPPANFRETVVLSGLTNPTAVEFANDGRIFVAEKSGLIKVFADFGTTGSTFADLRTEVHNFWDRGLLGLALHPNFPATPYVYALYTRDALPGGTSPQWGDGCPTPPGGTADGCVVTGRLVRLTASGNSTTGTPTVLITDWCQQFPSHSVADLVFGPDGMLYVSAGEGANFFVADYGQRGGSTGSPTPKNPCGDPPTPSGTDLTPPTAEGGALRSQDLRTTGADPTGYSGSILRIDPITGAAAAGNPLIGSTDTAARRIIAYGQRNPFRMTFRPGTSELWVGDVGWGTFEEINRITSAGAPVENFGWPCYEGPDRQASYDNLDLDICEDLYADGTASGSWLTYRHKQPVVSGESCANGSSSISGLAFYPGGDFPSAYDGALFFGDYSRNCIWVALPPSPGALPSPTNLQTFATGAAGPIELEIGPGGDLYYVGFGDATGGTADGTVRRIHYTPGNQAPNAAIQATPTAGPSPLTVSFDASGSSDADPGDLLSYAWDLDNDGAFDDGTSVTASRVFTTDGTATVRLRVTDSAGATDDASVTISVGNSPPVPTIAAPSSTVTWSVGQTIQFSGSADDGEGSPLAASRLSWSLVMVHCPASCHEHPIQTFAGVTNGQFSAPDHEYPSHLKLVLTATDPQGLSASTFVTLQPKTVQLSFASQPTGAEISIGAITDTTPFAVTAIVGSNLSVSAPDQQLGTQQLAFASWSDGGAQSHDIVAPATARTYTATFTGGSGPPAFGRVPDPEGYEGQTLSFALTATDPDGGSVTYAATGLPSGFSITASTGVVRGLRGYSGSGHFPVTITATDDEGAKATATVMITIHDALFPARRATFGAGRHTGLAFAPDGTVTASKAGILSRTSGASVDRRRLWNGRPYLHVTNGLWAGYWLPESAAVRLSGAVGEVRFSAPRRVSFVAGSHTGWLLSGGSLGSPKTATLAARSGASADRRIVVNGLPYLRIVNGIWAGRWVPEHQLSIAGGTHTAYDREAGDTRAAFTYSLSRTSGASAVSRVAGTGGWYLAVSNGVFADHWLRESSLVSRRVALED